MKYNNLGNKTIVRSIALSIVLTAASIYPIPSPQQAGVFTKTLLRALWDSITLKKELDRDWGKTFEEDKKQMADPTLAAKNFREAIEANPTITINPGDFLFGASLSAYQAEGGIGEECAADRFYKKHGLPGAGNAIDFWNKYEQYIKQLKENGLNTLRLSISWPRVEPKQGSYNIEAIKHYQKIIQTCKAHGIEPIVVLHHYTIPSWFEDIGGFTQKDNIQYFVDFATTMYKALADEVRYWSTFNAIEGYAFKAYYTGECGETGNLQKTAVVMAHMLESHVQIYKAIKGKNSLYKQLKQEHPHIPEPQIGIQKNIHQLDPSFKTLKHTCLSPISRICCEIGNMLQNEGFYGFFNNGRFRIYIPNKVDVFHENPIAPYTLDWIGVNTYSNRYLFITDTAKDDNPLRLTENKNYRFYPEGIYRAVQEISERIAKPVGKKRNKNNNPIPIIITENGIATKLDEAGEARRRRFYQQALHAITQAIKDGYHIIGYTPWAAYDNFEWHQKNNKTGEWIKGGVGNKRYGLFHVNFDDLTKKPSLKDGARAFTDFVNAFHKMSAK